MSVYQWPALSLHRFIVIYFSVVKKEGLSLQKSKIFLPDNLLEAICLLKQRQTIPADTYACLISKTKEKIQRLGNSSCKLNS